LLNIDCLTFPKKNTKISGLEAARVLANRRLAQNLTNAIVDE
jgi:hypothetical protein